MEKGGSWNELTALLRGDGLLVSADAGENLRIGGITADSRLAGPGDLFVCKGAAFKREYLLAAVRAGAAACLAEAADAEAPVPCAVVSDVRRASSLAARWVYGWPERSQEVIGITGTKGKTTTANVLRKIFETAAPGTTALFSTGEADTLRRKYDTHLTTPEPVELQGYLAESRDAGARRTVMEVSSQAMKLSRVYGMTFDYGIFLNLGEDHVGGSEHPTLEDYIRCKTDFLRQCRTAVINRHADYAGLAFAKAKEGGARCILYGFADGPASHGPAPGGQAFGETGAAKARESGTFALGKEDREVWLRDLVSDGTGMSFSLCWNGGWYRFSTDLIGRYNADNLAAAAVTALADGIAPGTVAQALAHVHIPGRMLVIPVRDFHVVIDYAHNRMSFENLCAAVRETFRPKRLHTVFGCPGERSALRRRDMGEVAGHYADEIYLTADDPGYEDAEEICREIARSAGRECRIIPDRETAVRTALGNARAGDVVILAGKGAETTQRVRGAYEPYLSDEAAVRRWAWEYGGNCP